MYGAEFVDYYAFLGVLPSSSREVIADRIRAMYKQWHPDVCNAADAHEMTVTIGEAKEFLLDESKRQQYDRLRVAFITGETERRSSEEWEYSREWAQHSQDVRHRAEQSANLNLEDLLLGIIGIAAVGASVAVGAAAVGSMYAWQGTDRFAGREPTYSFGQRFWCGIGGWACLICLVVPGTSIITFYCFYWAFFPGPTNKFIGCGTVLGGMVLSALILLPIGACLVAGILNGGR